MKQSAFENLTEWLLKTGIYPKGAKLKPETLVRLRDLSFDHVVIEHFPESLALLYGLEEVDLGFYDKPNLPAFLFELPNLRRLSLTINNTQGVLPEDLSKLTCLDELEIRLDFSNRRDSTSYNMIEIQFRFEFSLHEPTPINYKGNLQFQSLPPQFVGMQCLKMVRLMLSVHSSLVDEFDTTLLPDLLAYATLNELILIQYPVKHIPEIILAQTQLVHLDLSGCCLVDINQKIGQLINLSHLNLSDNPIQTLPNEIGDLSELKVFIANRTRLEALPVSIFNLSSLHELLIDDNKSLNTLPKQLFELNSLNEIAVNPKFLEDETQKRLQAWLLQEGKTGSRMGFGL